MPSQNLTRKIASVAAPSFPANQSAAAHSHPAARSSRAARIESPAAATLRDPCLKSRSRVILSRVICLSEPLMYAGSTGIDELVRYFQGAFVVGTPPSVR